MQPEDFDALPQTKLRFIEPMYARLVQKLPEGKDWLYEIKFDGYRCLAGKDGSGVTLWSRRKNLFTAQFPKIAQACNRLGPGTLVDGDRGHRRDRSRIVQKPSESLV
jgi:bifunctional non-homologous end joining protein LigD